MEIKRILRQYAFSLVLILCVYSFFAGIISVREKTQYNMNMTPYDTVKIEKSKDSIIFISGENVSFVIPDYIVDGIKIPFVKAETTFFNRFLL